MTPSSFDLAPRIALDWIWRRMVDTSNIVTDSETYTGILWEAISNDIGCYVMAVDGKGLVHFLNEAGARWLELTTTTVVGCSLYNVFPVLVAEERIKHIQQVLDEGKPLVVDGMILGEGLRAVLRPLPKEQYKVVPTTLIVLRSLSSVRDIQDMHLPGELIQARENDLGALVNLTPREIEVLKLIATGLTSLQIAKRLCRSIKTVQWHRASLGNKLGVKNRVELTLIAIRAGFITHNEAKNNCD